MADTKEHQQQRDEYFNDDTIKPPNDRVDPEVAKYASASRVVISPEENKRLKRLIDKRVLSIMIFTYFLQALDKGTLSFASIMGIREDTGLVNQQVYISPGAAIENPAKNGFSTPG